MTGTLALSLAAAAFGVIAGLWFCVGSMFTSSETVAELATSYWDYHAAHAQVVIEQSAQYSVGAPLLVIAFILQVLAALSPAQSVLALPSVVAEPLAFLGAVALLVWAASFFIYRGLVRMKGKRVHAILQRREQQQ